MRIDLDRTMHFYELTWEWGLTSGSPSVSEALEVGWFLTL